MISKALNNITTMLVWYELHDSTQQATLLNCEDSLTVLDTAHCRAVKKRDLDDGNNFNTGTMFIWFAMFSRQRVDTARLNYIHRATTQLSTILNNVVQAHRLDMSGQANVKTLSSSRMQTNKRSNHTPSWIPKMTQKVPSSVIRLLIRRMSNETDCMCGLLCHGEDLSWCEMTSMTQLKRKLLKVNLTETSRLVESLTLPTQVVGVEVPLYTRSACAKPM